MKRHVRELGFFCLGGLVIFAVLVAYRGATGGYSGDPKQQGKDFLNQYAQGLDEARAELAKQYDAETEIREEMLRKQCEELRKENEADAAGK